jgi:hypothetical protein
MADKNARYRPSDPLGRATNPAGHTNDPLAELARLIGRNDPFAELEREVRAAANRGNLHDNAGPGSMQFGDTHSAYPDEPAAHHDSDTSHSTDPRYGVEPPGYDDEPEPHHSGDHIAHRDDTARENDEEPQRDWPGGLDSAWPYAADRFSPARQQTQTLTAAANEQSYAQYPSDGPAFLQALYPQEPAAGSLEAPRDEFQHDDSQPHRRKGLLTVGAVFALAVIGTAGAFAYRNFFSDVSSSSPPPVIRASTEPTKVAPPTQPVDQTASKFSYDRLGDRGQNEQVVLREEKPVDNRELSRTNVPRTVLPGGPMPSSAGAQMPAQPGPNPPSALGEPRRVRTVPIRPDQPDTAAIPQPSAGQSAAAVQPPTVFPPAPGPRQPPTMAEVPANSRAEAGSATGGGRVAAARGNPRVAARTDEPGGNAPLSLSPDTSNAPPALTARESAPPRASTSARVAAAPAANGGGFLVQVSSQRSEADAENAYRSIQAKYSDLLGGQRHVIRRADLGSKGIYYRAMVGPFGTREEAIQLCVSLKAAGGDCVVQAN